MKIRILDDSVRLRLDRDEVDRIGAGEAVVCRTHFPDGSAFAYRLAVGTGELSASFADGELSVALAPETAGQWASDETEVSIRGELALAAGTLRVLVEKDFECLEPRAGESQANRFRNPKAPA